MTYAVVKIAAQALFYPFPLSYIVHLLVWVYFKPSVPGVDTTSGAAGVVDAPWHNHISAEGMLSVKETKCSSPKKSLHHLVPK